MSVTLGVNGWTDRTHDPAAALVIDGDIVAFVEQERLSRNKHGVGELAHQAVRTVVEMASIEPGDIDTVTYGWDLAAFNATRRRPIDLGDGIVQRITGLDFGPRQPAVRWVEHHAAHAASAFHTSGWSDAAVLVVDAEGENCSTSLYAGDNQQLAVLRHWGRGASLGLLYRACAQHCGFGQMGAGKVMGLAAYGHPRRDAIPLRFDGGEFTSPFPDDASEDDIINGWLRLLEQRFGPAAPTGPDVRYFPPVEAHCPDAAASVQAAVEDLLTALADHAVGVTGRSRLCLAGGVALNCVANGLIATDHAELHIPPATHDAGVALGSALWHLADTGQLTGRSRPGVGQASAALGPEWSDADIVRACRGAGVRHREIGDPARLAAEYLTGGGSR